ncbi:FecR family protein [Phenylobacterium sp. 58.2.17]|uniref:FecR family protein n=1 Tax=Phenylobacterium sp. 58.2.17 TaxID=2969306 RepID=UPI00226510AC|nr:FecR family protein [Phenylobacterium sp. 58.2.17]MCX7587283.1 FecR family protein [Phenylobacterium sp. 58.2.17]
MSLSSTPADRAKDEAAAWFARLNTRSISAIALEEFRIWRQTPGNREAYAAIEAIWRKTGALQGDRDLDEAVAGAFARTRKARRWTKFFEGLKSRPATSLGAVAFALIALFAGLQVLEARSVYETKVGEQRLVRLEDGSRVRLDTQTRVSVHFSRGVRRIKLDRGQAFFDVAADAKRPFVVDAGQADVRALGTRFDVRRDDNQVRVILVEGVVEVRATAPSQEAGQARRWTLKPGEQLTTGSQAVVRKPVDLAAVTSWTAGRITFRAVPLTTAIAEINRYSDQQVVLDAPDVGTIPVTGVFDSGDTEAFVAAVSDLHGLRPVRADGVIRLRPQSSPTGPG